MISYYGMLAWIIAVTKPRGGGAKLPPILLALLGPSCPPTTPVHNKKELIFSHFLDNEKLAKSSPNKRKRKKYSNLH